MIGLGGVASGHSSLRTRVNPLSAPNSSPRLRPLAAPRSVPENLVSGRAARASMITTMRCELGRGSRESITNSSSDQSRGAGPNWAPSTRPRAATNAFKSLSNVEWSRRTLCKRASAASAAGRSSELGGSAPSTNTGMTLTRRWSAAAISSTTRSFESSRRRRPRASTASNHPTPISASSTSQAPTARSMTSPKSSPGSMESTSMKTASSLKEDFSRSHKRPATCWASERR